MAIGKGPDRLIEAKYVNQICQGNEHNEPIEGYSYDKPRFHIYSIVMLIWKSLWSSSRDSVRATDPAIEVWYEVENHEK